MQRYLIIAIAILAGLLAFLLLSKMADRHIRGEAVMPFRYLIAGAVMIAVMVAGGIWLETGSGSPNMAYQPAQIIDGDIRPGQFNEK